LRQQFIDAANLLTIYFVTQPMPQGKTYSDMFAQGFDAMGLIQSSTNFNKDDINAAVRSFGKGLVTLVSSVIFFVIFSLVSVVVLGALFVMLLIRTLFLWGLLIFAPFAWLFWIFPKASGGIPSAFSWDGWWKEFLKWNIFAPVVSFIIFLAFRIVGTIGNAKTGAGILAPLQPLDKVEFLQATGGGWLFQYILFVGLLIFGMWAANQMGITGAKVGLDLANAAARYPGVAGAKIARRTALQLGRRPVQVGVDDQGRPIYEEMTAADRAARWLSRSRIPVLGALGRQAARGITALQVQEARAMKKEMERYKDFDSRLLARESELTGVRGLAARHELAKRGDLEDLVRAHGRGRAVELVQGGVVDAVNKGLRDSVKGYAKFAPTAEMRRLTGMSARAIADAYTKDDISEKLGDETWRAILSIDEMRDAVLRRWAGAKLGAAADRGGVVFRLVREIHENFINRVGPQNAKQEYAYIGNAAGGQYLKKNNDIWDLPFPGPAGAPPAPTPTPPSGTPPATGPIPPPPTAPSSPPSPPPRGPQVSPGGVVIPPGVQYTPPPPPGILGQPPAPGYTHVSQLTPQQRQQAGQPPPGMNWWSPQTGMWA